MCVTGVLSETQAGLKQRNNLPGQMTDASSCQTTVSMVRSKDNSLINLLARQSRVAWHQTGKQIKPSFIIPPYVP